MAFLKFLPIFLIIVIFWYILFRLKTIDDVLVTVDGGQLRGAEFLDMLGGKFYAFQSVPYAKPPIGELRFKAPQPSEKWEGIRDATEEIKKCLQMGLGKVIGAEDCLYLNVYTPEIPENASTLKPVMVYIHGGAFLEGSASRKRLGPEYLITGDVVIVAINYRVGAFGFLNLNSSDISANNGMKDQVMALKWVQRNIASFGGDPNLVTIFGESAGGASVDLLTLSPLAKGLFHRAIAQSGTALGDWVFGAKDTGLVLAKYLGIKSTDPQEIAKELRKVPAEDIFRAQLNTDWKIEIFKPWNGGLIVEDQGSDSFLSEDPLTVLRSGDFNRVPMIIGFTNKEGIVLELMAIASKDIFSGNRAKEVPYRVSNGDAKLMEIFGSSLNQEYFNMDVPREINEDVICMWSDIWIKLIAVNSAQEHSNYHDVYLYEFSADTQLNFYKKLSAESAKRPGASHVDDLGHLFKQASSPLHFGEGSVEDVVVRRMVKMWTNFAKYGVPIRESDSILKGVEWRPIVAHDLKFLNMTNEAFIFGSYQNKRIGFLNALFN